MSIHIPSKSGLSVVVITGESPRSEVYIEPIGICKIYAFRGGANALPESLFHITHRNVSREVLRLLYVTTQRSTQVDLDPGCTGRAPKWIADLNFAKSYMIQPILDQKPQALEHRLCFEAVQQEMKHAQIAIRCFVCEYAKNAFEYRSNKAINRAGQFQRLREPSIRRSI